MRIEKIYRNIMGIYELDGGITANYRGIKIIIFFLDIYLTISAQLKTSRQESAHLARSKLVYPMLLTLVSNWLIPYRHQVFSYIIYQQQKYLLYFLLINKKRRRFRINA